MHCIGNDWYITPNDDNELFNDQLKDVNLYLFSLLFVRNEIQNDIVEELLQSLVILSEKKSKHSLACAGCVMPFHSIAD